MSSIGLNVDRSGSHDPALIRNLGATWIRIVAMPDQNLRTYFQGCRAAGLKILLVLARESGGDYQRYANIYEDVIDAIQVGNEPDLVSPSSWTMTQAELTALGRSVRALFPTMPLGCGGLASGHPSWLDEMDLGWADAIAFHPYLKDAPNPSDLEDLPDVTELLAGYQRFGRPLIVSEWGWWGSDEGRGREEVSDMIGWAAKTDLIEVFFYFCISDSMVPPFGLLGSRGREKPAAKAFREQAALAVHSLWPDVVAEPEPAPEPVEQPTTPAPKTRAEVIAISNAIADELGIPRLLLLACGVAESNLRWDARRPTDPSQDAAYWPDVSPGVWQQAVRWSKEYYDWCRDDAPGHDPAVYPGDDVIAAVMAHYWDVEHAARVAAEQLKAKYALHESDAIAKALARYNWPVGGGAFASPEHETNYRRGIREAEAILGTAPVPQPGRVTFNPNTPPIRQNDSWSCAPTSARWAMTALGRQPSEAWFEDTMLAEGVVTREHGLMDATGAGLAAFIRRHYGEFGYEANHEPSVSFDWAMLEGSHAYPVLLGGRGWYHWATLRGYDAASGTLLLMNPAGVHQGVGGTMSRAQFDALGPFSAIRIWHKDLLIAPPAPVEPPAPPTDTRLERALAKAREVVKILEEARP